MIRKFLIFVITIVLLVGATCFLTSCSNDNYNNAELELINYDVTYKQDVSNVTLNLGFIETNLKIDNVFIVCDGITRNLNYVEQKFNGNFLYQWNTTVYTGDLYFNDNVTKTIETYIEYNGAIVMIDNQEVTFKKIDIKTPADLPSVG